MNNKDVNGSSGNFESVGAEIMAIKESRQEGSTMHIKKCYLFFLLMTVSIGTIQFGYSIGSWNTAFEAYKYKQGWDDDEGSNKQAFSQSLTTAGSAVGALFSGPLLGMGRWKCVLLTNIFVIVGAGMTLIDDWTIFLIGRFLYGAACGGFSVFCPKYISEVAPIELKGPAGGLTQICITFGIIVPFSIGLFYQPDDIRGDD
jgi:MFS family permease